MKQKIEQLARGIFEYQLPEILLSEERLQIAAVAGETYRGSFIVKNNKGSRMKGVLYSSSRLFVLSEDKFVGEEITVPFCFSAEYMEPGETVEGEISIITECGEAVLPFEVKVEPPACGSSIGEIRDMFQFTDLAKTNWTEAEQVFASEAFARMLRYHNGGKLLKLYRQLMEGKDTGCALEEFLVSIRKKSNVTIQVDKDKLEYTAGEYSFLDKVTIQRSTWGYTELKISTDCDFLQPRHERINSDAFHGNVCEESFVIDSEKLHAGLNCGHLFVESVHQKITIPVKCYYRLKNERKVIEARRKKQYARDMTQNYLRFRLNRISVGKYVSEAENALIGLKNLNGALDVKHRLYRIHLLIAENKEQQAKAELAELENMPVNFTNEPVLYAAKVYLAALCGKDADTTEKTIRIIRDLYKRYPEEWMLLWFLLYMDKVYPTAPERRMEEVRLAFYQGARTPVLYYEAVAAWNEKPECLEELNLFEIQMLAFAVKHQALSKETALRAAYLALQEKEHSKVLLFVLQEAYERFHEPDILAAICHMLLVGKQYTTKNFSWYMLGVREGLQEEGLLEAYLLAAPDDISITLESSVLNYFAYNNALSDERKSFLYANILTHRDAYAAVLADYEKQIESFTLEQLGKAVISRNMAVLYDEILPQTALTSEIAAKIPEICFYYEIACDCANMVAVCVAHKELGEEVCVPLHDGHAYIEMFTENAEVLLCDEAGNRYISTIDYGLDKLVHLESLFERCDELVGNNRKLLLNLAEKARYNQRGEGNDVSLRARVTRIRGLNPEYMRDYVKSLIYHHYDNYENEALESYLLQVDLKALATAERIRIIEYMILSDLFNVALTALDEFGFEGVDVKRLARLCNRLITNADGMEKVDVLVAVCAHVFEAGKHDEVILRYLTDYFYGTTLQMFELWKAARTMELDTLDLEERLLGQMLFAESYISSAKVVFNNYYRSGANRRLIRAFLSYYAYKYLLNDRLVEQDIFEIMRREIAYEENEVCLLAIMKWYSTLEQMTDAQVTFVDMHLNRFEQRGVILPFFRDFKGSMRIPQNLYDKYYVEYRTDPKKKVTIHYTFEAARGESGYVTEEMTNVCYGIFVKEFVLFSNESLQYYIVEQDGEEEVITESVQVRLSPEQTDGEDTKYYQLNEIIAARDLQDEKTALKLLENYIRREYTITQLFKPL